VKSVLLIPKFVVKSKGFSLRTHELKPQVGSIDPE
jgi:hypothetical protein